MDQPEVDRRFEEVVSSLRKTIPRRSFLVRAVVAGSVLATAPIKSLMQPAMAVTRCSNCPSGSACCGGYTTFCCAITGSNTCPNYTELGGWWKCTNYTGSGLCAAGNQRWYVDCNRKPGFSCPDGCHCANDSCTQRKTCCNNFKYGQCNVNSPVTEVVCRVVKCNRPCDVWPNKCECSPYREDNVTCSHDANCLS